jgi:hypothetical protein
LTVEPSAWARWKGILIENITKIRKTTTIFFYLLGVTENGITQKTFLIFFKLGKLIEDYHLLLPSKPLEDEFCCLENIDF